MNAEVTPRWKERLETFGAALVRLADVVTLHHERKLSEYECDSLIYYPILLELQNKMMSVCTD